MGLRIYPPIGVARVGNDLAKFFIGPEVPGSPGVEIDAQGRENAITAYKVDEDQIKRQAARFRLFDVPDDGGAPHEVQLAEGDVVEWTVHLVNKKAAVVRDSGPPLQPRRPQLAPNSEPLVIDPGARSISGANGAAVKFDTGEFQGRRVPLGELRTDRDQNLLVLGGFGFSSSPTNKPLPSFYTNPGWHDDVSDGPVTARVRHADGSPDTVAAPAWVMVGPPDFAPDVQGVVTLYDIMEQVAIDDLGLQPPAQVSFTKHVFPLFRRARRLAWVNQAGEWSTISDDWQALADPSAAAQQLRAENADRVRNIEFTLANFRLTEEQDRRLNQWQDGSFESDWAGIPSPGTELTPEGMTRVALDSTVGQGFFPGIEAGIITRDPTIYSAPFNFRINAGALNPGDLTALMAVPWQADFYDCNTAWWPAQRPDTVRLAAAADTVGAWDRGVTSHLGMVHNFPKLAFITAQHDSQGNLVFAEAQRADFELLV